jgi:hypothetical protein
VTEQALIKHSRHPANIALIVITFHTVLKCRGDFSSASTLGLGGRHRASGTPCTIASRIMDHGILASYADLAPEVRQIQGK